MDMFIGPTEQPKAAPKAAPVDEGFTFQKPPVPRPPRSPAGKAPPPLVAAPEPQEPLGPASEQQLRKELAAARAQAARLEQENAELAAEVAAHRKAARSLAKKRQAVRLDAEALQYLRQQLAAEQAEAAQEAARLEQLRLKLEAQAAALAQQAAPAEPPAQQAEQRKRKAAAAAAPRSKPPAEAKPEAAAADSRESSPRGSTVSDSSTATGPADIGDSAASIHGRSRARKPGQEKGWPPAVKKLSPPIAGMTLAVEDAWEPVQPNSPKKGGGGEWAQPPQESILDSLKNWGTDLEDLLAELPPPPEQQQPQAQVSPFQAAAVQSF